MAYKVTDITEVFKTIGQPTITYVEREQGHYERLLSDAIDSSGQLCLLTGASKTGKTTLYKRVLHEKSRTPVVVRCDRNLTAAEFWRRGLEMIQADRVTEVNAETESEISGKLGLSDIFSWAFKPEIVSSKKSGSGESRERILADPSPENLISILKEGSFTLVVEDFHYLNDDVKIV